MVNSGKGKSPMRGCIRGQRGPWLIRRATKKGMVTSLRFPSDKERENNKIRERARRKIKSNIFAGLRAHGGYDLPSNAHNNLVLVALCEEAGWRVLEDGTIFRKDLDLNGAANGDESIKEDNVNRQPFAIENVDGDDNVDLSLSLY